MKISAATLVGKKRHSHQLFLASRGEWGLPEQQKDCHELKVELFYLVDITQGRSAEKQLRHGEIECAGWGMTSQDAQCRCQLLRGSSLSFTPWTTPGHNWDPGQWASAPSWPHEQTRKTHGWRHSSSRRTSAPGWTPAFLDLPSLSSLRKLGRLCSNEPSSFCLDTPTFQILF